MNREIIILPFLLLILKNDKKNKNIKDNGIKGKELEKPKNVVKPISPNIVFDESKAYKLRDIASSVMTFLPEREKVYCDLYINGVNIYDCIKKLNAVDKEPNDKIESIDIRKDRLNKINMLKALKPHLAEDKQKTLDLSLSLSEFLDELMSNWQSYTENLKRIIGNNNISVFEKISNLIEMFKPVLKENINVDKLSKQMKMMDLVMKAEGMFNDSSSGEKKTVSSMSEDQSKFINNIKSLLNNDQQKAVDKIMELLSPGVNNKDAAKTPNDEKKEIIEVKPDKVEEAK